MRRRCGVDKLLDRLPPAESAVLEGWLYNPAMGDEHIELELERAGYYISDTTIYRWRKRRGVKTRWARS